MAGTGARGPRVARATLPNGVRVTAVSLPGTHRVAIVCLLRVGSRYETPRTNGISHLLEHMLYRGIPGFPTAHAQALAFEKLGSSLGATTGTDTGSLSVSCPEKNFERTLDLLGRVFRKPLLGGLAIEKGIIREEILEDLDERGNLVDPDHRLRHAVFGAHPLGMPVTGTAQGVSRFGVAALRRHHGRHYTGQGTSLAIAGPLSTARALAAARRAFGKVRKGQPPGVVPPARFEGPAVHHVDNAGSQTSVRLGFRGGSLHDPLEPATELLLRVLDDGNSTRLYTRLCDELGLTYDVSAGYEASDDVGLLDIACEVAHPSVTPVLAEIFDVLASLRDRGPTAAELAKAKARHRFGLDEMQDDPGAVADFFADATLRGYARSIVERHARIDAVSRADVRAAARKLLRAANLALVTVGVVSRRAEREIARSVALFG